MSSSPSTVPTVPSSSSFSDEGAAAKRKSVLIRVSSGEISASAAAALNKLSSSPSTLTSSTNRNHQTSALCRSLSVALLIIICVLIGTDLLGTKGTSTEQSALNSANQLPAGSSSPPPPSSTSPSTQRQQEQEHPSPPTSATPQPDDGSPESSLTPYFIDTSDYWSQPGSQLFAGTADPKSARHGVYYEHRPQQQRKLKLQSEVFKCYFKDESEANSKFKLQKTKVDDSASSSSNQPPDPQHSSTQTLTNYYFQPPRVVASSSSLSSSSSASFYQYDVLIFPVGCFGDVIPLSPDGVGGGGAAPSAAKSSSPLSSCPTTSCKALAALARFVPCGKRPIGLVLGDNFYPNGLSRRTRGRLEADFSAKFLSHKLFRFPWFGTLGNHDGASQANRQAQFRFHKDSLWVLPQPHHATPPVAAGGYSVQVFLVSTLWGYDTNWPHMAGEAAWLDAALGNSTADIKIVASHEPIYGFLGFEHSRPLVEHIDPVLRKHGVIMWLAAHAHSIHFHRCPGGYYQLVSAGFADNLHQGVRNTRPRGHFYIGRGASAVAVNSSHVVVTAMDVDGRNIFNFAFDWKRTIAQVKKARNDKSIQEFLGNDEIGYGDGEMWKWGKMCDQGDSKMKAWWC